MTSLLDPVWEGLPESMVRKMIRAVAGTKDLGAVTPDERAAIREAMLSTWEDGQSATRWRARTYGLLRQRGMLRV